MKYLGSVVEGFDVGHTEVDLQGAEGRSPAHTDAGGGAEGEIVHHAGRGCTGTLDVLHLAQGAEIREETQRNAITFRQQGGKPRLQGADRMGIAAQSARVERSDQVAGADARQSET